MFKFFVTAILVNGGGFYLVVELHWKGSAPIFFLHFYVFFGLLLETTTINIIHVKKNAGGRKGP